MNPGSADSLGCLFSHAWKTKAHCPPGLLAVIPSGGDLKDWPRALGRGSRETHDTVLQTYSLCNAKATSYWKLRFTPVVPSSWEAEAEELL